MYRYAQIDPSGVCMGISFLYGEVDSANMIAIGDTPSAAVLGQRYEDGNWTEVPTPEPISGQVEEVSDRQFFQALYLRDEISKGEALAAIGTGAIPAAMQTLLEQLPSAQQEEAEFLLTGATTFKASHPIADMIRILFGWSAEQRDEFWRFAATL